MPSVFALRLGLLATLACTQLASPVWCADLDPRPIQAQLQRLVEQMTPQLRSVYQDLHAHPELGFQETRTAATLAAAMRKLGFEVTEGIGKTGLMALYRNGTGPTVMVRTEMDALPMEEKTGLPYASKAKAFFNGKDSFVAHSCGHDMHMTSWLGTAQALLGLKAQWKGTLMFVAQPAEESSGGAKAMLADGLFEKFGKPHYAFALHTGSMAYGTVGYVAGAATSNSDGLNITFHGRGGHGSMPAQSIDPVLMAARFVVDVQSVVSREKEPAEFGVVTVGAFNAGSAGNIIPDQARVLGTIRSYQDDVRSKLKEGVERTARATAAMAGAPAPEIKLTRGGDAVINDPALTQRTVQLFKTVLGEQNVVALSPSSASEDFSAFVNQGVPSLFYVLGISDPLRVAESKQAGGKPLPFNHSPFYAPVPEPTLQTGITTMTLAVMNVMQ
jgi:hippurate hydrolase